MFLNQKTTKRSPKRATNDRKKAQRSYTSSEGNKAGRQDIMRRKFFKPKVRKDPIPYSRIQTPKPKKKPKYKKKIFEVKDE